MAASDARPIPRKNVAFRVTFPILDADGDLVTGAASLDSEVSIDGGTFADCTNEATEIATNSGMYFLDLTSGEMNGDTVAVIVKTATAGAKTTPIVLYPEEVGDVRVDCVQISGDTTAADNAEAFFDGTGYAGTNNTIPTVTSVTNTVSANVVQISGDTTAADNAEAWFDDTGFAATNSTIGTATTVTNMVTANVTQISGDAVAADNLEAVLDGTGGVTLVATGITLTNPVIANATQISGDATAADNAESFFDGTGYAGTNNVIPTVTSVTNMVTANVTQLSGDATAADNAEAFFDGTGYAGTGNVIPTVTNVTNGVTVATNNDKAGYALSSSGLDSVSTAAPTGVASTFREMVVATWRWFYKKTTLTATQLDTFADNGTTVITSATVSDTGTVQTKEAAT